MTAPDWRLPDWITWQQRPFPSANLLLLAGGVPAMVDSGFVAHAPDTVGWVRARTADLQLVVNTHWHSDHIGANGLLQSGGAAIAASAADARSIQRRDPGCCLAEYLDQPVAPYTVDEPLTGGQVVQLGRAAWRVIDTPGHTPGHLALWQPEERVLVVGDALSDYDVGWVNTAVDGPGAADAALASLQRLADLRPRVILPAHGSIPLDTASAFSAALRRAQRLVDDPDGAVWYGARRIFAFALMIRRGIPVGEVEPYLQRRAWLVDAARLLRRTPEDLAAELVQTMTASGAVTIRDGRLDAAADHTPVPASFTAPPFPREWWPGLPSG